MKKESVISIFIFLFSLQFAASCVLDATIINQDPYPAVPGDYVKVVFQLTGTSDPTCGTVLFELIEQYPISFDPGESPIVKVQGGTYNKDYSSSLVIPYKVRVDSNAIDGSNKLEVRYGTQDLESSYKTETFNIEVDNSLADFEVYIKDYDFTTQILTLEILNIAEVDVEALTLEIPQQENMMVKGAKTNIVGDLDSNEYTTAEFTGVPKSGQIKVNVYYSDSINERRTLEKTVLFEPSYFITEDAGKDTSIYQYVIYGLIIVGVVIYLFRRSKKKKERRILHHQRKGEARLG